MLWAARVGMLRVIGCLTSSLRSAALSIDSRHRKLTQRYKTTRDTIHRHIIV